LEAQSDSSGVNDTLTFCFLSDTQIPLIFERISLGYNHNEEARKLIFDKIREIAPKAVFHLGDFMGLGFDPDSWDETVNFVKELGIHKTEFYPIPGNHEYIIFPKRGIANFQRNFKGISLTGYSKKYNDLAVMLFNSNFDNLNENERREQAEWYKKTINNYEADSSINFIIVGTHHSPYTNSRIVLPATESADKGYFNEYLEAFYASKKCKLFISGHTHAFEHFNIRGKDFLVIGGGGGIQQPLYIGENERYHDLFSSSLEKRMFHFITVKTFHKNLTVELEMVDDSFSNFTETPQLEFQVKNPNK
jgi:3',5'-cyclic AMP phosphodiesterase CpdA